MGAAYIVRKRARFVSINGPVNLPYGTPVDAVDGFLVHKGRPLCAVTSDQMRWDLLWSDPEAQKLRHPDHADYWLWGHAFFEADMADLEHVAGLIGARR